MVMEHIFIDTFNISAFVLIQDFCEVKALLFRVWKIHISTFMDFLLYFAGYPENTENTKKGVKVEKNTLLSINPRHGIEVKVPQLQVKICSIII